MAEQASIAADLAWVERHLALPNFGFESLRDDLDFLRSPEQTRHYLVSLRKGLEAVRDGRVVPHAEIVRDMEERYHRHHPHAAE